MGECRASTRVRLVFAHRFPLSPFFFSLEDPSLSPSSHAPPPSPSSPPVTMDSPSFFAIVISLDTFPPLRPPQDLSLNHLPPSPDREQKILERTASYSPTLMGQEGDFPGLWLCFSSPRTGLLSSFYTVVCGFRGLSLLCFFFLISRHEASFFFSSNSSLTTMVEKLNLPNCFFPF